MKKKLLLALGLTAGLFLTACGDGDTSESETVDTTDMVYVTGIDIVDYTTGESIDTLSISTTNPGDIEVVVTPTNATVQTVTWTVSEEGILDLSYIDYGAVYGLSAGTVTLTATADGAAEGETVSDSITVTVSDYTYLDIADFATEAEDGKLYAFAGILEDLDHTDIYGNCYITDPLTGDTLYLYGSTTDASALSVTGSTWDFDNPYTAVTTLADFNNGEWVTGYGVWTASYSNLSAVFLSHEATTDYTYTASVADNIANGSIVLDKTEDLLYGDTVTVTVTPDEGYVANNVVITTAYGTEVATKTDENVFTFGAYCVNTVSASFISDDDTTVSIDLTESSGNLADFDVPTSGYGDSETTVTLQGYEFDCTNCGINKYSGWEENVLCIADNASYSSIPEEGGSLVVNGAAFSDFSVTYRHWGTYSGGSQTLKIWVSNDGENWTQLYSHYYSGVNYTGDDQVFTASTDSEGTTFTGATYLKLTCSTDDTQNRRVGIFNITFYTAE